MCSGTGTNATECDPLPVREMVLLRHNDCADLVENLYRVHKHSTIPPALRTLLGRFPRPDISEILKTDEPPEKPFPKDSRGDRPKKSRLKRPIDKFDSRTLPTDEKESLPPDGPILQTMVYPENVDELLPYAFQFFGGPLFSAKYFQQTLYNAQRIRFTEENECTVHTLNHVMQNFMEDEASNEMRRAFETAEMPAPSKLTTLMLQIAGLAGYMYPHGLHVAYLWQNGNHQTMDLTMAGLYMMLAGASQPKECSNRACFCIDSMGCAGQDTNTSLPPMTSIKNYWGNG